MVKFHVFHVVKYLLLQCDKISCISRDKIPYISYNFNYFTYQNQYYTYKKTFLQTETSPQTHKFKNSFHKHKVASHQTFPANQSSLQMNRYLFEHRRRRHPRKMGKASAMLRGKMGNQRRQGVPEITELRRVPRGKASTISWCDCVL